MTSVTDIVNRALQKIGTRTTVTDAELANGTTNEAIQANLALTQSRDDLLRMAPWDCGLKTANLTYITSTPGTPENTSPATFLWQPGQPAPPWAYEYQYPVDCLRACWLIPATQLGYAGGVPITTAVTGGSASQWLGPPVKFKVQTDSFRPVIAATVASAGTGNAVGDVITLAPGVAGNPPIGAPAQLLVISVNGSGGVTGVSVINQVYGEATPFGGSYFTVQPNPVAMGSTTGSGSGASFNLTFGPASPQRVILTNQEYATLSYVQTVSDPNVMDLLFINAWTSILGAMLCMALTGDDKKANLLINLANKDIMEARTVDANEGLTINDVTPDFLRVRGWTGGYTQTGPYIGFDWGGMWPIYG